MFSIVKDETLEKKREKTKIAAIADGKEYI